MRERDLQDYLFANPEVLFPGKKIQEKAREYYIHGKRIDLLFLVEGFRYIVELKSIPVARDHIGQVIEYYGLMKEYLKKEKIKMILVSPSIPKWRSLFLEELGIRCVEITEIPQTAKEENNIAKESVKKSSQLNRIIEYKNNVDKNDRFGFVDFEPHISDKKMGLVNKIVEDSLVILRSAFQEYEIIPYKISRPVSLDFDYEYHKPTNDGLDEFTTGNAWWAFRFGFDTEMPPNDVPNISIIFNTSGLDITIDAEIMSSQKVMLSTIQDKKDEFNNLIKNYTNIWFKSYLKYEHQPRAYHWILTDLISPEKLNAETILNIYNEHSIKFDIERNKWVQCIKDRNKLLTENQKNHLDNANKKLNFAMRLARRLQKKDEIWNLSYEQQKKYINAEIINLKPLLDFFINKYADDKR